MLKLCGMAFGVDETSREQLADRARRYKCLHQKTYETDLLIIDEISVMKNHYLEPLNFVVNSIRDNEMKFGESQAAKISTLSFGGVQMVDVCPMSPFEQIRIVFAMRASQLSLSTAKSTSAARKDTVSGTTSISGPFVARPNSIID